MNGETAVYTSRTREGYSGVVSNVSNEDSPPSCRSVAMSQNLAFSMVEEVSHMIRINSIQLDSPPPSPLESSPLTPMNTNIFTKSLRESTPQDIVSSEEYLFQRHRELKSSKSIGGSSSNNLGDSSTIPITIPIKRGTSMGKRNDILIGIVVSKWDNIVGPQCTYLWTEEMTSLFYPGNLPKHLNRLIKYVTDHTMDHQDVDGSLASHSTPKSGLCIVSDLNLVYMSLSIRVPADLVSFEPERPGITIPHSVSVLANLNYLQHFLLMRPLLSNWLMEMSPKIGILVCKNKLHLSPINSWCAELCKTIGAVRSCWWQKNLTEKRAALLRESNGGKTSSQIVGRSTFTQTVPSEEKEWDYLPPPSTKIALEMILTSHLSTSCSTIVVGPDSSAINQVIRFLLCFSKAEEGFCSRYVLPTLPDTLMKGLFVQGLISGEIGEKSVSVNQVQSNRHPFTYIELSTKCTKVRQMPIYSHQMQREVTLLQELTALWHSTSFISPPTELFPLPISEIGGFISTFLTELLILKPKRRYGRLLLFRRMLHTKALQLITYFQSIQFKPHKERAMLTKKVKEIFCWDDAEFLIVQMTAEKIRPGILRILRLDK